MCLGSKGIFDVEGKNVDVSTCSGCRARSRDHGVLSSSSKNRPHGIKENNKEGR